MTLSDWLHKEEHAVQYTHARQIRAEMRVDEMSDICDDIKVKKLDPNAGRVIMDAIKWQSGKENKGLYGDSLDMTSKGKQLTVPVWAVKQEDGGDSQ